MSSRPPATADGEPRLRRDAERNRRRILAAAAEAFAEGGLAVTMDEIARRAGVGVGTVYRRFPDKELLIEALFEQRIDELVVLAEAAREDPDPWHGLVHFLETALALQAAGELRPDVAGPDLALVQLMLGAVVDQTRDVAPDAWRRFLAIVLDGLRTPDPGPLPVRALSPDELQRAIRDGV